MSGPHSRAIAAAIFVSIHTQPPAASPQDHVHEERSSRASPASGLARVSLPIKRRIHAKSDSCALVQDSHVLALGRCLHVMKKRRNKIKKMEKKKKSPMESKERLETPTESTHKFFSRYLLHNTRRFFRRGRGCRGRRRRRRGWWWTVEAGQPQGCATRRGGGQQRRGGQRERHDASPRAAVQGSRD